MAEHSLPGTPDVPLTLRRSGRARRISLRISGLDGRVTLTLPNWVSEAEALAFARSRENWIRGHLGGRTERMTPAIGAALPVEGVARRIVAAPGKRVILSGSEVAVPTDAVARRLRAWLTDMARDRLTAAADRHADALGRSYSRISLRDTRSRWGSCSSQGALMFSWRLVLAPPDILDYVAAHEVAHLAEMNHSPAFWAHVQRLYGSPAPARRWLRANGAELHRFQFSD